MKKEPERWEWIDGYENLYQISSWGKVKSFCGRKERILALCDHSEGYSRVTLCNKAIHKTRLIHILVANSFIPNPEKKPQVNHIDENKKNNYYKNLERRTAKENTNHGTSLQRRALTQSKSIKQLTLSGILVREWVSASVADRNGYCQSHIAACCNNKPEFKTHKGFRWEYV